METPKHTRTARPPLAQFPVDYTSTSLSVDDLGWYCYNRGYAMSKSTELLKLPTLPGHSPWLCSRARLHHATCPMRSLQRAHNGQYGIVAASNIVRKSV
ncbi:hypothetical protein BDY17DRAFT_280505, partial [Neohortaea acidophila]